MGRDLFDDEQRLARLDEAELASRFLFDSRRFFPEPASLLEVRGLSVRFRTTQGLVHAVNGIHLTIRPGEMVGLVGESGSGKSVSSRAIMGLLPPRTSIVEGSVRVVHVESDGSERFIHRYEAGDHIGELAVLREAPRAATVIAEGDGVRGLVIGGAGLRSILLERPDAAMAMLAILAERLGTQQ